MPSQATNPSSLRPHWLVVATRVCAAGKRPLLIVASLVASVVAILTVAAAGAAAQDDQPDIIQAITCLGGNGRLDINLVNNGDAPSVYRIELGTLSPRELTIAPGDWGRMSVTGRRDGDLSLRIAEDGVVVRDQQVTVACDTDPPQVTPTTVQVVNSCRAGNGYILFQLANNTSASRPWVIEFEGVPNRSTTTAPWGAAVRAVTGRPDGTYNVLLRSGGEQIQRTVTVLCDSDPVEGNELLVNGDYAQGTDSWWSVGTSAGPTVEAGEFCLGAPSSAVLPWDTLFGQSDLAITAGTNYVLSFDARSDSTATITAVVQRNEPPWTAVFATDLQVGSVMTAFTYPFTGTAEPNAVMGFQLGTGQQRSFCFDNVSLMALGAGPQPTPSPTPTPEPGLSPAENLALILSNPTRNTQFDNNAFRGVPMDQIEVSDLTLNGDVYNEGLLDTSASGYFRVKCEISHFAYDDPIIFPNQPGRAHLHMFFGNTEANAYSTFDSLLNSGTGTCNGEDLNRTSYWVPALLNGNGDALIPFEVMVYYKNDLFRLNGANELVSPFPDNLRMVVGNAMATSPQGTLSGGPGTLPVVSFNCGRPYGDNPLQPVIPDCFGNPGGNPWANDALEMKIAFPQCHNPVDGTYLRNGSHMSYSEGGYYGVRCPASHPEDMSSIMYRIMYSPSSYGGSLADVRLSSDVRPDGTILPGGTTAHADWFGAWHPGAMNLWIENCNNTQADCEIGLLNRDPALSLVPRKRGFYPTGYLAPAEDLINLCPGRVLDPARRLESIANCRMGPMAAAGNVN